MESVEDIILRHSRRGMDRLRPLLAADFCHAAARAIFACPQGNVFLTTGFCVKGFAETDGPAGTWAIARRCACWAIPRSSSRMPFARAISNPKASPCSTCRWTRTKRCANPCWTSTALCCF